MRGICSIIFGGVIVVVAPACQGPDEHAQAQPEVAVSATACANCARSETRNIGPCALVTEGVASEAGDACEATGLV